MAYSKQLQAFDRVMKELPDVVAKAIEPKLVIEANKIAGRIQRAAPEDSGDLKDSVVVTPPGGSTPAYSQPGGSRIAANNEAIITVGNTVVRYPHLIEYGTSKMAAQPYFWPTVRTYGPRGQRAIKLALGKLVKAAWQRS